MAGRKISRKELAKLDAESLMLDPRFLRFLSTVRAAAGIETVAYGPEGATSFLEGRRSLWCTILATVEQSSPDALVDILIAERDALKETHDGRRTYDRLKLDDTDGSPGARSREPVAAFLYDAVGSPDGNAAS